MGTTEKDVLFVCQNLHQYFNPFHHLLKSMTKSNCYLPLSLNMEPLISKGTCLRNLKSEKIGNVDCSVAIRQADSQSDHLQTSLNYILNNTFTSKLLQWRNSEIKRNFKCSSRPLTQISSCYGYHKNPDNFWAQYLFH
jgi:hypothetical protein